MRSNKFLRGAQEIAQLKLRSGFFFRGRLLFPTFSQASIAITTLNESCARRFLLVTRACVCDATRDERGGEE